jgi:RsiW-degrading membrane proteinase PrsW (M82 family)
MVQAAQSRQRYYSARRAGVCFLRAFSGRLLRQAKMRSILVEVADVATHQSLEVLLVENNHMVEQIATAAADKAFGNAILPGALEESAGWIPIAFMASTTSVLKIESRS